MTTIAQTFRRAVLAAALIVPFSAAAHADLNCALSTAAGDQAPAAARPKETGHFRIFWHIATKIEDMADSASSPDAMAQLKATQGRVDGYYFNALLGGPLVYWPQRPAYCDLNFLHTSKMGQFDYLGKHYDFSSGKDGPKACVTQQRQSFGGKSAQDVQMAALKRVFTNLDLKDEQRRGKEIWGATIINQQTFAYDPGTDSVALKSVPATVCTANALGVGLNAQMVYQEPGVQAKMGTYLRIPLKDARGRDLPIRSLRRLSAPMNTRVYSLVGDAYAKARVPAGGFLANIRFWEPDSSPQMARAIAAEPIMRGFNFEAGTLLLVDKKRSVDDVAGAIAWLLQNTSSDISILMPGYWPDSDIGTLQGIDGLIPRLKTLVTSLNDRMNQHMGRTGGRNAICTSRLTLIPASYGSPIQLDALPVARADGRLAGTVGGEIKLLSQLRSELCGG